MSRLGVIIIGHWEVWMTKRLSIEDVSISEAA
jgi:hypothetical protein